jgi:hypothetical protein
MTRRPYKSHTLKPHSSKTQGSDNSKSTANNQRTYNQQEHGKQGQAGALAVCRSVQQAKGSKDASGNMDE